MYVICNADALTKAVLCWLEQPYVLTDSIKDAALVFQASQYRHADYPLDLGQ
ncbi:hypothetical protein GJV44_00163 [Candidatus Vallotia cooleyia]|nr:hypothetical protein GJV44_00163 [Candidatus Vallotia cooleyia]